MSAGGGAVRTGAVGGRVVPPPSGATGARPLGAGLATVAAQVRVRGDLRGVRRVLELQSHLDVGPDACVGANLPALLRARWVLGVGPARAGSVARVPGRPLVMGCLHDAVDWALRRVEVIQPVVSADRVRVFGCPGADLRTGKRIARSARRASHLTSGSGTCTCTRKGYSARRSREEGLRTHYSFPLSERLCSDKDE